MTVVIIRRRFLLSLAVLVTASSLAAQPTLEPISDAALLSGSPLHIPLNGLDPAGGALTFAAESSDPGLVATHIPEGNRSLRLAIAAMGDMVLELFEARAPRATNRIVELTESGFYDGVTFHRVIDGFVIQGGDPLGDGTGGSALGTWDDQFHVDLQHNRSGVLSTAKTLDDTNDSQFFITESPTRGLDFNYTIFGQLVIGEDVREAISNVPTDAGDRPLTSIVIERAEIIEDTQNGVLMLKAPEAASGTVLITVTATDAGGVTAQQTFTVNVTPDTEDSAPFLADIPTLSTKVDTEFTYQLKAIDVEGDSSLFLDEETMDLNGLPVPARAPADLTYRVESDTGVLRVTPLNGLTGTHFLSVATGVVVSAVDYQIVTVQIDP